MQFVDTAGRIDKFKNKYAKWDKKKKPAAEAAPPASESKEAPAKEAPKAEDAPKEDSADTATE